MLPFPPADELVRRVPRLMLGLVLFVLGIAFLVQGDLGLSPRDVLPAGVDERSGLAIGPVTLELAIASCRERVCLHLSIPVVASTLKTTTHFTRPPRSEKQQQQTLILQP